jgi:hypothetical protein
MTETEAGALEIVGESPNATSARADTAGLRWSRWRIETVEQFRARVVEDARRLGLLRLRFEG